MPKAATRSDKSFEVKNIEDSEPLTFDLGGEEFTCFPEVQGKMILDIIRAASDEDDPDQRGMKMAVGVLDFFEKVMDASEYERFNKLMEDPKRIVPMETLSEIMSWLIEEYTERPDAAILGLLSWADQHWPYLRGWCLVQTGLRLERMPAQDMLDVLHYLFESDALNTQEEQDAKHRLRTTLYTQLYERTYSWNGGGGGGGSTNANGTEFGTQEVGGGTKQLTHKPYIPPTPVDATSPLPYGSVLDAPLG